MSLNRGQGGSSDDLEDVESKEVEKLAELRRNIQERISKLEVELDEWKTILRVLDRHLPQISFKKATIPEIPKDKTTKRTKPSKKPSKAEFEYERTVSLKTTTGVLLAELQIGSTAIRVVPVKEANLKTSIPPFESFLINRIFDEMIKHDEEDVRNKKLPSDKVFSYEVRETEDETITEIQIRNYRTDRRLRELRTSIRWTLEKIYEKIIQS